MSEHDEAAKQLLRDGKNREAAELMERAGNLEGAMEALAAVWEYVRAAHLALRLKSYVKALDYLLRSGERQGALDVCQLLAKGDPYAAGQAVELLKDRGEKDLAARLLEASGDLDAAAELLKSSGELRRAAALYERADQYRNAGRIYERILSEEPDDGEVALSLAAILQRFGRHEAAARMFQKAALQPGLKRSALKGLVAALAGMGLHDAAHAALEDLLDEDASAPRSVDALLESQRQEGEDQAEWFAGRYEVVRLLGGGAAGRVYLARDVLYEREVALKVLAAGEGGGKEAFERFAREASIAAKLEHPNIVKVLDFHQESNLLAMEYLAAGTLADRIQHEPLDLPTLRSVLDSILKALEAAHMRAVVHRDVKPANVLFGRAAEVKLADFGVAHLQDLGLTQTGSFIGTLTYMAPEQITGDKVSASTDLYGLGTTFYHALCGRPPFVGADLVRQHLAEDPPPPSETRPALGTRFDAFVAKLLAKTQDARFGTAAEVRRAAQALDFTEPTGEVREPAKAPEPVSQDTEESTFKLLSATETTALGKQTTALHRAMEIDVTLFEPKDPRLFAEAKSFAKVSSPYVQQVLDVDVEGGQIVYEAPQGTRVEDAEGDAAPLLEAFGQLARGLEALHAAGINHGAIDSEHVVICTHRAVLRLPVVAGGEPANDVQALVDLFGSSVGVEGSMAEIVRHPPVTDLLGERRSLELANRLGQRPTTAQGLREQLEMIQRATQSQSQARGHMHALAAAVRAAGADPAADPIADFLAQRRQELGL